uniref:Uncharacterized protein n=1 Tax=Chrysotila carterae TaxID=13221 RepID=A0A7S4BSV4_CHRCT|mmetsp:Transcript_9399/g.20573  ORF Transcript_9399/g.20573 Transcript_9399/m.20573 type:complete len:295 (-) Transcript_9399:1041-1925(-)
MIVCFAIVALGFPGLTQAASQAASQVDELNEARMPLLTVLTPSEGEVLLALPDPRNSSAPPTSSLQMRYAVQGGSTQGRSVRLCLRLLRSPLRYYGGPLLSRDVDSMRPYAAGCFLLTQPVTLANLSVGSYALVAQLRDSGETLSNATSFFAVSPSLEDETTRGDTADDFAASYEWQSVREGQSVPSGLEVQLSLDGSHRRSARIPPTWRLQLFLGEGLGFLRTDVLRDTRVREVLAAAEAQAAAAALRHHLDGAHKACFSLFAGSDWLDAESTVESAQLFSRRGQLHVRRRPT